MGHFPYEWCERVARIVPSISAKIGCAAKTLNEWIKKVEVLSGKLSDACGKMVERTPHLDCGTLEPREDESDQARAWETFVPTIKIPCNA